MHTRMSLVVELAVWSSNWSLNLLFTLSQAIKWGAIALGSLLAWALHCIDHYNAHKEFNYIHIYSMEIFMFCQRKHHRAAKRTAINNNRK